MRSWIFQGNPDLFDVDEYLVSTTEILWTVRQKHFAGEIKPGDEVFIWRSSGSKSLVAGVIAQATVTSSPQDMHDDEASKPFWKKPDSDGIQLRVALRVQRVRKGAKEVVRREWLKTDPILADLRILHFASETNYLLTRNQAERLAALFRNTGRDWSREESIAGLWAYARTFGKPVSMSIGSPVVEVALTIGRPVTGVYNKVMNFRALDNSDPRKGLTAGSHIDDEAWAEFFDASGGHLNVDELDRAYRKIWGRAPKVNSRPVYTEFGDAPDDDPEELQKFAMRVRRGQPVFRRNLLAAYGNKCCVSGWGPDEVLEAVHIVPHSHSGINRLDNGLLLRADLHTLFDAHLLRIEPESLTVEMSNILQGTPYWEFHGTTLRFRVDGSQPKKGYLRRRWNTENGA